MTLPSQNEEPGFERDTNELPSEQGGVSPDRLEEEDRQIDADREADAAIDHRQQQAAKEHMNTESR